MEGERKVEGELGENGKWRIEDGEKVLIENGKIEGVIREQEGE